MAIKLNLINTNPAGVRLDIYRDTQIIDRENLPEPIFTTTDNISSWIDETVVKGVAYYYVFKTTGSVDFKISRNIKIIALDDKGVGEDKLYYGNLDYGYYGNVPASQFFSGTQLAAAMGLTFPAYGDPTMWHKFAHQGKTVFVPNAFIGKGLSYNELVAAGLLEGKVIQHGQFQYKVRLMKGYDPTMNFADRLPLPSSTVDTVTIPNFDSEFDRLVYPMSRYVPTNQIMHNIDARTMALLGYSTNVLMLMAEIKGDSSACLCRGIQTETSVGLTHANATTPTTKNNFLGFLPVVELIEPVI